MKNWLFAYCVATTLLLIGCKNESAQLDTDRPVVTDPPKQIVQEQKQDLHRLEVDPASFHFIADWLSDEEIIYVEKNEGLYQIQRFNIVTGDIQTVFEDPSIIIDVLIHPSRDFLLIHTSNNPLSATVKVLSLEGLVEDEIVIESSELAMEWNTIDPNRILLTAFHEDWTFDLFLYDGEDDYLELVELDDPFPKWFGKDLIATGHVEDHSLNGGTMKIYDPRTRKQQDFGQSDIVYFDTYGNSVLTVQVDEREDAVYTLWETDGAIRHQWKMPAVSNYSEWVIPEIAWVSDNEIFLAAPETGGLMDELQSPIQLFQVKEKQHKVVAEEVEAVKPRCSPSGKRCLTGFSSEILISTETGEKQAWLSFREN
ncbi:hypothetical protein AB1K83_06260 [Sporosarcina sp. 179-K 3D1 HS]|uniref:YqgU-like beta propeller domain-containing protein n=1 Tax=Sporosarcina sp. 179-K 3D1 HS TaxID=3232169 RepID=UPI0039A3E607